MDEPQHETTTILTAAAFVADVLATHYLESLWAKARKLEAIPARVLGK